ncbi:unnamed protein product [Protopolystoma xenopodis]|uniref:Uncharacterized protein n=1 Tax=Protopolystoma xenopodis TaxID=117903 RepID=A0A3S5AYM3_9PLAT|nr:unnamed protein product [Protopolystoma xenopodis]
METEPYSGQSSRRRSWSQHNFLPHIPAYSSVIPRAGYSASGFPRALVRVGSRSRAAAYPQSGGLPYTYQCSYYPPPTTSVLVVGGRKPIHPFCPSINGTCAYPLVGVNRRHSQPCYRLGDVTAIPSGLPTSHLKASKPIKREHILSPVDTPVRCLGFPLSMHHV